MMQIDPEEYAALVAIVGAPVLDVEPCGWGFENRTVIVTLGDGRRLVVQRIAGRATARHKLRMARTLPPRLLAAGLRAPRLLSADPDATPPYAVREYLPGEAGARSMGTVDGAVAVATSMGALLPRLAQVSVAGAGLQDGWAHPERLAGLARRYLDRCRALLGESAAQALVATIAEVPARFAGRPACFAHGDFCPVNVLVEARDLRLEAGEVPIVVGLLDLEFARVADPLFDAAWWGWVVRFHHPERWVHAFPHLLAAAGISGDAESLNRIHALQHLRCLEVVDYHLRTGRAETAAMWAERLRVTLAWG